MVNNRTVRMLCDTGALCDCISLQYYKTCLARTTSLIPHRKYQNFTSANNSVLDVVGSVKLNIKLGGCVFYAVFHVILGVEFMERTGALLDYRNKQMSLFDGSVSVPLLTSIDLTKPLKLLNASEYRPNTKLSSRPESSGCPTTHYGSHKHFHTPPKTVKGSERIGRL